MSHYLYFAVKRSLIKPFISNKKGEEAKNLLFRNWAEIADRANFIVQGNYKP